MYFTKKQVGFLTMAAKGLNLFLTGKAGTGKSTVVTTSITDLIAAGRKAIACAPTGIAATNINGQTIHSLFSLKPFGVLTFEECNFVNNSKRDVLKNFDTLVIDEVSMLRPDTLDAMHWTLKKNGLPGLDTKQVIFVGDLKQLPVVLDDNARSVLYQSYDGDDFTFSQIYKRLAPQVVELDEIVRQSDPDFIEALNVVREGGKHAYFSQFVGAPLDGSVILAPHNVTVAEYNKAGLDAQEGQLHQFEAEIHGAAKPQDFNLDPLVEVKHGAKIMYLINSRDNPLRNGTVGEFVVRHRQCFGEGDQLGELETLFFIKVGGVEYKLDQYEAVKKVYEYDKRLDKLVLREVGSIKQYPIRLAYALSIHKSQGMTFDKVAVDLRRPCFMKGQMYVALSRVKTPAGLRIII